MEHPPSAHPCAQIIPFERPAAKPRRRGRPRKEIPKTDLGTPELILKRAYGLTAETLDICLERGVITRQQHWCGIHLRWLFTLRNGAPGLRAIDPSHFGGQPARPDDPSWRVQREEEYREAMQALAACGHAAQVVNACVYNERPLFLTACHTRAQILRAEQSLRGLHKGLNTLVTLWRRGRGNER